VSRRRVLRARRRVIADTQRVRRRQVHDALARVKRAQRDAWARQAAGAAAVHEVLRAHDAATFTTPSWRRDQDPHAPGARPPPPLAFLRRPEIQETMEVRSRRLLREELGWLRRRLEAPALARALEEDYAGDPALALARPATSQTAVHHLYHLERFAAHVGAPVAEQRTIVEWGGGFGGFARTLRRHAGGSPPTQVIVDLPVVGALQWTFLTTVFGPEAVDVAGAPGHRPRAGAITLVPPALAAALDVRADLFVSLWGMSETARAGQDAIVAADWFGARRLLVAFQRSSPDFPEAARTGELVEAAGGAVVPIGVLPRSAYGLR
jgi:hypothetical protein